MAVSSRPSTPRLVSLRRQFLWVLIGVVGLFGAGMTLSLLFSLKSNRAVEERLLNVEAAQAQASVTRRWDYYRRLVDHLGKR